MAKKENQNPQAVAATKKAKKAPSATTKDKGAAAGKKTKKIKEKIYGDRSRRHHAIMFMSAEELHEAHPFTQDLVFNEEMKKKDFKEPNVPDESCIMGTKTDGTLHRFVVGNEQAEILPRFLQAKWVAIESKKVWGNPLSIETSDEEKDRLYAMIREAQLRGIKPL